MGVHSILLNDYIDRPTIDAMRLSVEAVNEVLGIVGIDNVVIPAGATDALASFTTVERDDGEHLECLDDLIVIEPSKRPVGAGDDWTAKILVLPGPAYTSICDALLGAVEIRLADTVLGWPVLGGPISHHD